MGAFDGLSISRCPRIPVECDNSHRFFSNSSFSFFRGFGENELKKLLEDALINSSEIVWVPKQNGGSIGFETWYIKALVEHHFKG